MAGTEIAEEPDISLFPKSLSKAEYVVLRGKRCPTCMRTDSFKGKKPDVSPGEIEIHYTCSACDTRWIEYYKLDRYIAN